MKNYKTMLTGLAGESAVMAALCLKGWCPSMAYNNCPTFDILCYNPDTKATIAIQVKTVREKKDGKKIPAFPLMGNRDERQAFYQEVAGPYIFVYIDKDDKFSFYILSKAQFISLSSQIEEDYDNLPRKKPLAPKSPMAMPKARIEEFEDQWDNLWR